jgi:hypothetical protein
MQDPTAVILDRLARVLGLAAALSMLATLVLAFMRPERAATTGPPLTLLVAMGLVFGYLGLEFLAARFQQRRNRAMAVEDKRGYFVYLRSLKAKELQSITHSGGPANPSPNAFIVDDILEELDKALKDIGTLFVIGSKETGSMAWSPTTILLRSSERSWRPLFARLAKGARVIFIIPGSTPGIIEELTQIAEKRLLHKVVVVMPPATGRDGRRKAWNAVVSALGHYGWTFPTFVEQGMVYAASSCLAPRHALPYVVDGKRNLGEALCALVAEMPQGESVASAIAEVERIERGAA